MIQRLKDNTIQVRQLLTQRVRTRDALITTLLWLIYAYLWLPLISFVAWIAGIDFAYERVIKAGGPEELMLLLLWFLIAFLIVLLVVVTWSGLQYSRHHGKNDRRVRTASLDAVTEQAYWGINAAEQTLLKQSKTLTVELDSAGAIALVKPGSPAASG